MAEHGTVPSSADDTDHEEKFEDANAIAEQSTPEQNTSQPNGQSHTNDQPIENGTQKLDAKDDVVLEEEVMPAINSNRTSKASNEGSRSSAATGEDMHVQNPKSRTPSIDQNDATPKPPTKSSRFGAFSASLPSVPWGAAVAARRPSNIREPSPQPPPPPPPATRRNTPFAWLSRATSAGTGAKSPPLHARMHTEARRNTAASISTLGSNPEMMLKALEDTQDGKNGEKGPAKQALREKFKMLRMQQEANASAGTAAKSLGPPAVDSADHSASAEAVSVSPEGTNDTANISQPPRPQSPDQASSVVVNTDLPPGNASGFSASAGDVATPIDWDFWQSVVNEGPQAVARSSPEELNGAIAGGIPHTIRGVIWQVLASSKNEELEAVYHELRIRGTKDEPKDISLVSTSSVAANGSMREKESVASSKSSIHSDHSTPVTSTNTGPMSPSPSNDIADPVNNAKLQAQLIGERARKRPTDAAALNKLEKMIKRDMGSRTSYSKYAAAAGFQDGLFNVCRAYALFDDAVGYPQGMNFIIMPILFNMSEEEAFCLLVRMMHRYHLRELFIQDMPGLHLHLYQFERLLEDLEPALFCHLNRRSVTPKLYATQWFLTLFAYRLPLQLVMRVFDLVLCEGLEGAILKFGMALIQRNVQALLAMDDMQALTTYLKEKLFDVYIDSAPSSKSILESGFFGSSGGSDTDIYRADILVQDACAVKLTPEMLARYTTEWEEKTTNEKARETELENLKSDTSTKAAQIRSLEQRAEKSDAEHIELANELVKLKVENQDLIDQNESLAGQVEELRKVAESEAANVEERLKASTEKVMQKNIEVQNENRHMEEQMAEMERELVEMKMKYAELNGEHEGLKQKWSDLKKALE